MSVGILEQTREQQAIEALRRLQHMATEAEGMTRAAILKEVRRVTTQGLRQIEPVK
jgi:hypothetical protein